MRSPMPTGSKTGSEPDKRINIVIGVGSDEAYGVDMSGFEDDGYIIREHGGDVLIFGATGDGLDLAVRKYAKAAETSSVSELDEVYHEGERIKKLTVAGCDISEYTVVYPAADCNENMLFAPWARPCQAYRKSMRCCAARCAGRNGR